MPGLLNEIGSFVTLVGADGVVDGTKYNNAAAGATGMDTRYYDQAYIHIVPGTGCTAAALRASVICSSTNSPTGSDATTVADFGTILDGTSETAFILTSGQERYMFLATTSGNDGTAVPCFAEAMLYNYDRPPVGNSDTVNVDK